MPLLGFVSKLRASGPKLELPRFVELGGERMDILYGPRFRVVFRDKGGILRCIFSRRHEINILGEARETGLHWVLRWENGNRPEFEIDDKTAWALMKWC